MARTLIYQFLSGSSNTIRVPAGYSNQVAVYAWGAGGGNGSGAAGAGAGFVGGILTVNKNSEIYVSVGGGGTSTTGYRPVGEGGVGNNSIKPLNGGVGGTASDEDGDSGSGGGGGGASAVFVNNVPVVVAAGGGGGAGYGDDRAGGATAGTPGGIATKTHTSTAGGPGTSGGGGAGGGGAGYPLGGAGGQAWGDDNRGGEGGYGGQNYANVAVVSDADIQSGSGTAPGGLRLDGNPNVYYPGAKRGHQGYDGAVILIFTKSFRAWEKRSGNWKQVTAGWVKTSDKVVYSDVKAESGSARFDNIGSGTWTVPRGVTSVTATVIGGGGGGGGGCEKDPYVSGGGGGGSGGINVQTITVTPGQTISYTVGRGGEGISAVRTSTGGGGTGTAGSASAFGSITATGGQPATNSSSNHFDLGGTAGSPSGTAGSNGVKINSNDGGPTAGGNGGGIPGYSTGGSGAAAVTGQSGSRGTGPGAGGGGGAGKGGSTVDQGGGAAGNAGAVILEYSTVPSTVITGSGGWKQITRAWIKKNGSWKLIETPLTLDPIVAPTSPTSYQEVNLVIAANTNNYVLEDYLGGTGYFPGKTIINITVASNVTVTSTNSGEAAITIGTLAEGDIVNLYNNGTIVGRGGNGGAAGSYSTSSGGASSSCFIAGTPISTPNGLVNIEDIQVGDLVWAYDGLNEPIAKPVVITYKHDWAETSPLIHITHEQGDFLVTAEHEILCSSRVDTLSDYEGFVTAGQLAVGDIIYTESGSATTITGIEAGPLYNYSYNFEVDDLHTYIAHGIRVHNGGTSYTTGTTIVTSVAGRPGGNGGTALLVKYPLNIINNGTIAGGGGGGGGGGGPTGGQGGGGAGFGSGANNGTKLAPGAGAGLGGAGGAPGVKGSSGTSSSSAGGAGGQAGHAIIGAERVTFATLGTVIGPLKNETTGLLIWSTAAAV